MKGAMADFVQYVFGIQGDRVGGPDAATFRGPAKMEDVGISARNFEFEQNLGKS